MDISVDLETDYSELVLRTGNITLGEKNRSEMEKTSREKQNATVLKAVCALLNSGGGVIRATVEQQGYSYTRDGIGEDLVNSLNNILPFADKYLDFVQEEGYFNIFVKSWDDSGLPIVTLKTNLYERVETSSVQFNNRCALAFLRDMKSRQRTHLISETSAKEAFSSANETCYLEADSLFESSKLKYKEKFLFSESKHVEFKSFETSNWLKRTKEILPKTISAFANTDGGYLFIGLDEDTNEVIGVKPEKDPLEEFERVENYMCEMPVYHFCEEKQGIKYKYKVIEVHDSGGVCSYVLALKVERFCCALFAEGPRSWHMEDNCVKRFTTEEWVQRLMDTES